MKGIGFAILVGVAFAGTAQAQSYQQFQRELFCQQEGNYAYQALADYRDGMAIDSAEQRADGYICTDMRPVCDVRRGTLRKVIAAIYRLGDNLQVRNMTATDFLSLNDENRTQAVSACMEVARR